MAGPPRQDGEIRAPSLLAQLSLVLLVVECKSSLLTCLYMLCFSAAKGDQGDQGLPSDRT